LVVGGGSVKKVIQLLFEIVLFLLFYFDFWRLRIVHFILLLQLHSSDVRRVVTIMDGFLMVVIQNRIHLQILFLQHLKIYIVVFQLR